MNTIHFIGYSAVHPSTFLFEMVTAPGQYTLIITATPVQFLLDGQWQEYPAGTAMLYAPGQSICYRACRDTYQNDWIRFTSDDPLVTQFPLQSIPFPVSDTEYCHHLFKLLTWETSFATADSDLIIASLLQVLFLRLRQDTTLRQTIPHASALLHLHKKIYNSPQLPWTIQAMAQELHLSTGYTQILYKQMFHISCMDDVINNRIRLAKEQLLYTEKPIAEIAEACGYRNVEHFCRQFRRQTDITPGVFRRSCPAFSVSSTDLPQKETASESSSEAVSDYQYTEPAAFISRSHYNVAGPDMPKASFIPGADMPPQTADPQS